MRVVFSVPRYHPNHDGMVIGLLAAGHQVAFAVQHKHPTETYVDGVEVYEIAPSLWTRATTRRPKTDMARIYRSLPALGALWHIFGRIRPDVVIARNLTLTNYVIFLIARFRGIGYFLYVQSRLGYEPMTWRARWLLRLGLWPRHTLNTTEQAPKQAIPGKTFDFIPFAIEPYDFCKTAYPSGLPIRILAIGKYDDANKHNAELVRALASYLRAGTVRLTLIGLRGATVSPVYQRLLETIAAEGVGAAVTLCENLSYDETRCAQAEHDLFIMPSTRESAGIAPVEAMAAGLPVITSSDTGTKYFVAPSETGFIFQDRDFDDLAAKVAYFIADPAAIERMGRRGRQVILDRYSPADFACRFTDMVTRRFAGLPALRPANPIRSDASDASDASEAISKQVGSPAG